MDTFPILTYPWSLNIFHSLNGTVLARFAAMEVILDYKEDFDSWMLICIIW
jgi:hypothetical protein